MRFQSPVFRRSSRNYRPPRYLSDFHQFNPSASIKGFEAEMDRLPKLRELFPGSSDQILDHTLKVHNVYIFLHYVDTVFSNGKVLQLHMFV